MLKASLLLITFLIFMSTPFTVKASEVSKKVLFIHHSTGGNLIKEGNLRDEIKKLDPTVEFWDHNYNLNPVFGTFLAKFTHLKGLSDNNGKVTGTDYNIVISNNSPKEYADIFSRDLNDPTLKSILDYDVIAFKNCYPTTRISTDEQLEEDIKYYKIIRDNLKKYSNKKFIVFTPPPARKKTTNMEQATRAKKLVDFLNSKVFIGNSKNIYVFDFYNLLADENGYLKKEFNRLLPWDSHPNKKANLDISPFFASYMANVINTNN